MSCNITNLGEVDATVKSDELELTVASGGKTPEETYRVALSYDGKIIEYDDAVVDSWEGGYSKVFELRSVADESTTIVIKEGKEKGFLDDDIKSLEALAKTENACSDCYQNAQVVRIKSPENVGPFVVMRRAKGGNLYEFLKAIKDKKLYANNKTLYKKLIVNIMIFLKKAVEELIEKGLYFFDLKPQNILVLTDCVSNRENCTAGEISVECLLRLGDHGSIASQDSKGGIQAVMTYAPAYHSGEMVFENKKNATFCITKILMINYLLILAYGSESDPKLYLDIVNHYRWDSVWRKQYKKILKVLSREGEAIDLTFGKAALDCRLELVESDLLHRMETVVRKMDFKETGLVDSLRGIFCLGRKGKKEFHAYYKCLINPKSNEKKIFKKLETAIENGSTSAEFLYVPPFETIKKDGVIEYIHRELGNKNNPYYFVSSPLQNYIKFENQWRHMKELVKGQEPASKSLDKSALAEEAQAEKILENFSSLGNWASLDKQQVESVLNKFPLLKDENKYLLRFLNQEAPAWQSIPVRNGS